jgi:hypothetical protein
MCCTCWTGAGCVRIGWQILGRNCCWPPRGPQAWRPCPRPRPRPPPLVIYLSIFAWSSALISGSVSGISFFVAVESETNDLLCWSNESLSDWKRARRRLPPSLSLPESLSSSSCSTVRSYKYNKYKYTRCLAYVGLFQHVLIFLVVTVMETVKTW